MTITPPPFELPPSRYSIGGAPLYTADQMLAAITERDAWWAAQVEALRAELERERMRLAACGVVALANTHESAASARQMHADYRSGSLDAVEKAVDREMAYREQIEALRADSERYRWLRERYAALTAMQCAQALGLDLSSVCVNTAEKFDAVVDAARTKEQT